MSLRIDELHWDDNNVDHLWRSHAVNPDEVEEIIFGIEDEPPVFLVRRDGDGYVMYGETGSGRLLKMVGELVGTGRFRVFGAMDMDEAERRAYRKRKF